MVVAVKNYLHLDKYLLVFRHIYLDGGDYPLLLSGGWLIVSQFDGLKRTALHRYINKCDHWGVSPTVTNILLECGELQFAT